jgi:hypothetical protein
MEKFRRELIFFFLLLILLLPFLIPKFTALLKDLTRIFLSINNVTTVCAYLRVPSGILINDIIRIETYCRNCGNLEYSGYTEITVWKDGQLIFFNTSGIYDLKTNEEYFFYSEVDPDTVGSYNVILKCYYPNNFTTTSQVVEVKAPPTTTTLPPVEKGVPIPPAPAVYNMTIEYPKTINVTQEAEYIFVIKVTNIGNQELHNIHVDFASSRIKTRITYPLILSTLKPKKSSLFIAELEVPSIETGDYTIDFNVTSDEVSVPGRITVVVEKLEIKEKAENLLDYYESLLHYVEDEIEKAREERKNVTKAEQLLQEAWDEWKASKRLYELHFYDECIQRLEEVVRKKIQEVIIELSRAKKIPRVVTRAFLPTWFVYLLMVIIAVVVSVVALFTWRRKRRYRPGLIRFRRW